LVCVDLNGKVIWRQSKGGMGAASHLASDGETVFVRMKGEIYRALVKNGAYTPFTATNSTSLSIADLFGADDAPQHPHAVAKDQKAKDDTIDFAGLACGNGKLYLSSRARNTVLEVDAAAGTVVRRIDVPAPGRAAFHAGKLLVLSGADKLLAEDVAGEKPSLTTVVSGLTAAVGVAVDAKSGRIFISTGGDDNQVKVFTLEGKLVAAIGRPGGRPKLGPWMQDGMRNAAGLCVDPEGKLWVAEASGIPKRISIWNAATGAFVRELFGPTNYGAGGGCILPTDPDIMFGQGCEWKLDPATGQATCLATVSEQGGGFSRFLHGPKDRPLLMTTSQSDIRFFERLAPGQWKLRATVSTTGPDKKANPKKPKPGDNDPRTTRFWSDANDDGIEQESEVAVIPGHFYQARGFHLSGYAHVDCSIKGRYDNPPAEDPQAQAGGRGKKGERAPRYEASAVHIPPVRNGSPATTARTGRNSGPTPIPSPACMGRTTPAHGRTACCAAHSDRSARPTTPWLAPFGRSTATAASGTCSANASASWPMSSRATR
jgi:outer membrane protein assembly factor BamB